MCYCVHYKFESKVDQFRVNKQDADCFEHLHEENTKPLVNVSVSHA